MKSVKILGPGCPKCKRMEALVREYAAKTGLELDIEKVEDMERIMQYDILRTPALVVDGEVKLSGVVPTENQLKEAIG